MEQPENIPKSLLHSIINDYDAEAIFSVSDNLITTGIASAKDSELLGHIPITKILYGVGKFVHSYQHNRYVSKVLSFIAESSKMDADDRAQFIRKLDENPEEAQKVGEILLDIIDKVTSTEKAIMIGKVVRAYGHEEGFSRGLMLHICEIIERAYLQDLQGLQQGEGYNTSNLESVGIIKPIRHEDIEKIVQAALESAKYEAIPIRDPASKPPPPEPKIDRSGLTEEGSNLQRILNEY